MNELLLSGVYFAYNVCTKYLFGLFGRKFYILGFGFSWFAVDILRTNAHPTSCIPHKLVETVDQ
ncbi:MAG TPA: hypothetical protein DEH22_05200 [Chloroflexi bacterium]|nr:hypothetical protein [Chloroflexota bacterium]